MHTYAHIHTHLVSVFGETRTSDVLKNSPLAKLVFVYVCIYVCIYINTYTRKYILFVPTNDVNFVSSMVNLTKMSMHDENVHACMHACMLTRTRARAHTHTHTLSICYLHSMDVVNESVHVSDHKIFDQHAAFFQHTPQPLRWYRHRVFIQETEV
jgi:hypothetical protein